MQVDSPSKMVLLFTPSTNFDNSQEDRILRIFFEGESGDWCKMESELTVESIASTEIDIGEWSIDEILLDELTASCFQNEGGDYIEIEGFGELAAETSYGLQIGADGDVFKTAQNQGNYLITIQLLEGLKTESISFEIALSDDDRVVVSAVVSDAVSINCTIDTAVVNLGTLFKGGAYTTSSLGITTESTNAFYWAVYGQGGPETENAGLYNSDEPGYLLSSAGVDGSVDLLTGEGFGMVATSSSGFVLEDFNTENPGIFGAIGKGASQARLFLYKDAGNSTVYSDIIYGVRASSDALTGDYNETLTYICGGYIGGGN